MKVGNFVFVWSLSCGAVCMLQNAGHEYWDEGNTHDKCVD